MKPEVHSYQYRILAFDGEVLEAGVRKGVKPVWREIEALTGLSWSYQITYRVVTSTGFWVAGFRPPSNPTALHLVLVERLPTDDPPPP
jgi:hypothetical protein